MLRTRISAIVAQILAQTGCATLPQSIGTSPLAQDVRYLTHRACSREARLDGRYCEWAFQEGERTIRNSTIVDRRPTPTERVIRADTTLRLSPRWFSYEVDR